MRHLLFANGHPSIQQRCGTRVNDVGACPGLEGTESHRHISTRLVRLLRDSLSEESFAVFLLGRSNGVVIIVPPRLSLCRNVVDEIYRDAVAQVVLVSEGSGHILGVPLAQEFVRMHVYHRLIAGAARIECPSDGEK